MKNQKEIEENRPHSSSQKLCTQTQKENEMRINSFSRILKGIFVTLIICLSWGNIQAQTDKYDAIREYLNPQPGFYNPSHHRMEAWFNVMDFIVNTRDNSMEAKFIQNFGVNQTIPAYSLYFDQYSGWKHNSIELDTILYSSLVKHPTHWLWDSYLPKLVRALLTTYKANPNIGAYLADKTGNQPAELIDTPLGYAAGQGMIKEAEQLLRAGAEPNYRWDKRYDITWEWIQELRPKNISSDTSGWFALKKVVTSNSEKYMPDQRVQMINLLAKYGADMNALDNCGKTALTNVVQCVVHFSSSSCPSRFNNADYQKLVQVLMQTGANPKAKGRANNLCSEIGNVSALDVLKEFGSRPQRDQWEPILKGK